jgi:hypothetical protein
LMRPHGSPEHLSSTKRRSGNPDVLPLIRRRYI